MSSTIFGLVQGRTHISAAAASSHVPAFPLTPTQDNLLIATVVSNATVATPSGWSADSSNVNSTGTYIFRKVAGASESQTLTLAPSSSADISIKLMEWSGCSTTPFDKQANASPTGTASQASGNTATLSQPSELVISTYGYPHSAYSDNPVSWSGSMLRQGASYGAGTDQPANETAFKRVAATTAVGTTVTLTGAATGNSICLATYKITGTTFVDKPAAWVDMLGHFECGQSAGTVVTNTILASCFTGTNFSNRWVTISDPDAQTPGATPGLTIETAAYHDQDKDILVEGLPFLNSSIGSLGMRATQSANNCIQLSGLLTANVGIGFHWRWNGAQIDSSPRDFLALRSDSSGNYQFFQAVDGAAPAVHAHAQPNSGTGVGTDVTIAKGHWYYLRAVHVAGGGTFTLEVYDAQSGYTLVGTSALVISGTESIGTTTIQIGQIKYAAGSGQSMDFKNIAITLDGTLPVIPSAPPAVGAITEAGTTADAVACALVAACASAESGAAADTTNGLKLLSAATVEAGTAADTPASTKASPGAISETGTASESPASVKVAASAITEAGTSVDTTSLGGIAAAAMTETGSAAESAGGLALFAAATSEAGAASDTQTSATGGATAILEAASAADSTNGAATLWTAVVDAGAALDSTHPTGASAAGLVEAVAAVDGMGASSSSGSFEYGNDRVTLVGARRRVALVAALQRVTHVGN